MTFQKVAPLTVYERPVRMTPNFNTTSLRNLNTVSLPALLKVTMNSILLKIAKRTSQVCCQKKEKLTLLMFLNKKNVWRCLSQLLLYYSEKGWYCKVCSLFAQCVSGQTSFVNKVSNRDNHINQTILHHLLTFRHQSAGKEEHASF